MDERIKTLELEMSRMRQFVTITTTLTDAGPEESYEHVSGYQYIVEHSIRGLGSRLRFSLRNRSLAPNLSDFARILGAMIEEIRTTTAYDVRNITLCFICGGNRTTHVSLPRQDIEDHGWETILQRLEDAEDDESSELYGDYEGLEIALDKAVLDTAVFAIHVTKKLSGGCPGDKLGPYWYKVYQSFYGDYNCLIECFDLITNTTSDPNEVRRRLGIPDGEICLSSVPLLEQYYGTQVSVCDDAIVNGIPVFLHGDASSKHRIVLYKGHYSLIDEPREHVYEAVSSGDGTIGPVQYYFFDFETVWDPNTLEMKPYAYSILAVDGVGNTIDKRVRVGDPSRHDVCADFMEYIILHAPRANETKYLIGYNNSRFDNYILVNAASANDVRFGNEVIAGTSILFMTIMGFKVKDLFRFTGGSLEDSCRDFGCTNTKGVLEHQTAQEAYMEGKFADYMNGSLVDIVEYCSRDTSCLAELYFIVRTSIMSTMEQDIDKHMTLPSMVYKSFKQHATSNGVIAASDIPILDASTDRYVRRALVGGRAQVFRPGTSSKVTIIDRVSQYPHVMMSNPFPIGRCEQTNGYVSGKIGVYDVTVHSQPRDVIVPTRGETLDWGYKNEALVCRITNVELDELVKRGHSVTVHGGVYWKRHVDGLFAGFLTPIMEHKKAQDVLRSSKDRRYNQGIRECMKRMANCLSGKLIQRTYTLKRVIAHTKAQADKIIRDLVPSTVEWYPTKGNAEVISGNRCNPRPRTPTIWGVLVYAYARRSIYNDLIEASTTKIMTDTDSLALETWEYEKLRVTNDGLFGSNVGQLRVETEGNTYDGHTYIVAVAPKCYCVYSASTGGIKIIKRAFKGIDVARDREITNATTAHRLLAGHISVKECDDIYHRLWAAHGPKTIGLETYERLARGESIVLLCKLIQRCNATVLRSVYRVKEVCCTVKTGVDSDS